MGFGQFHAPIDPGANPFRIEEIWDRMFRDTFWGQGPLVRSLVLSDGVPQLIRKGADLIGWERLQKAGSQSGRYVTGIGHGRSFHTSGAGAPQPGDVIDYSGAMIKINEDGSVDVWFGPSAPEGHESNWVQTVPGKSWNTLFRLYGPEQAWYDGKWRPSEIEVIE